MRMNQVTLPCTDYEASVRFYLQLGLRHVVDNPPKYARFETPTGETLSIHQVKSAPRHEVVIYFEVDEVDAVVEELQRQGLEFESEPADQPWLWREAYLRDPAGNLLCIFNGGENRRFPPWRLDGRK